MLAAADDYVGRLVTLLHAPMPSGVDSLAIAGLLGGRDAATVQSIAQSKFRAVSLADGTLADMMHNKPDPAMLARPVPAPSQSLDAFASHT